MKRLPRSRWLLAAGLLIVLSAGFLPLRIPIWTNQYSFELGPGIDGFPDSVDFPLSIFFGEAVDMVIEFNDSALQEYCDVYVLVNYQYPTKFVSEAALRFSNQSEISCTISWEDVRLIPVFVTGFLVRVFYSGSNIVQVSAVFTRHANIITYSGFSFMAFSVAIVLIPMLLSKIKEK